MLAALAGSGGALAIDNPDAPDRSSAFLARAQPFEARLAGTTGGAAAAQAGAAYAAFLEIELNQAYQQLLPQLGTEARRVLVQSQRQWLLFRDAETRFITRNWTPQDFGSSSTLSRANYSTTLTRHRVLTLLEYLQNYPAGKN